jgi:hypothetical protein
MAHVLKKSIHYAAEKEMEPYARAISVYLPGQKQAAINDEARGGLVKDADATKKLVKKYQAAAAREIDV